MHLDYMDIKFCFSISIIFTGHWSGIPSFALLEAIRHRIELSDKTYKECFPIIFSALHLRLPQSVSLLLRTLRGRVNKAKKTGDVLCLMQEFTGLAHNPLPPVIGPRCAENGITPDSLLKGKVIYIHYSSMIVLI